MTTVTVEEAETVTKEVTRYECDKCGGHFEGDETADVLVGEIGYHIDLVDTNAQLNWKYDVDAVEQTGHLCRGCLEADRYVTLKELADDRQRLAELIEWTGAVAPPSLAFTLGATLASGIAWTTITEWWTPYEAGGTVLGAALAGAMLSALFAVGLYAINARLTA